MDYQGHPVTCNYRHCEGAEIYISINSQPRHEVGVGRQRHAPADLPPGKSPGAHRTGGTVGPMAGLDGYGEDKTSYLHRSSSPGPSSP